MSESPERFARLVTSVLEKATKPSVTSKSDVSGSPNSGIALKDQVVRAGKGENSARSSEVKDVRAPIQDALDANSPQARIAAFEKDHAQFMPAKDRIDMLSTSFKPESVILQAGIARLQQVKWDHPSADQLTEIQVIMASLPKVDGLANMQDEMVLSEIHQAVLTHYYRHIDVFNISKDAAITEGIEQSLPLFSPERYENERRVVYESQSLQTLPEIQAKYKAQLDALRRPMSIKEKLTVIKSELTKDPKANELNEQFEKLQKAIETKSPSVELRKEIETIINGIPSEVDWDSDLMGIAGEIKQVAFNEIMQHGEYTKNIQIKDRATLGKTFRFTRADGVLDDERYLAEIGLPAAPKEPVLIDPQAELALAQELAAYAVNNSIYDVEHVFKTLPYHEGVRDEVALEKINQGPEWVRKISETQKLSDQAKTLLAELSDAHAASPDLLKNPAYLYMKGAQYSFHESISYIDQSGGVKNEAGFVEMKTITDAIKGQINELRAGNNTFNITEKNVDRAFELKVRINETGMSAIPPDDLFDDAKLASLSAIIAALPKGGSYKGMTEKGFSRFEQDLREIQNMLTNNSTDSRKIFTLYSNLQVHASEEILNEIRKGTENPLMLTAKYLEGARAIDGYNTINIDPELQRKTLYFREQGIKEAFDRSKKVTELFDGVVQSPLEDDRRKIVSYMMSDQYERDVVTEMRISQDAIDKLYDGVLDTNGVLVPKIADIVNLGSNEIVTEELKKHPFYTGRSRDEMQELQIEIDSHSALARLFGSVRHGIDMDKQVDSAGMIGDRGFDRIGITNNGGANDHAGRILMDLFTRASQMNGGSTRMSLVKEQALWDSFLDRLKEERAFIGDMHIKGNAFTLRKPDGELFDEAKTAEFAKAVGIKRNTEMTDTALENIAYDVWMVHIADGSAASAYAQGLAPGESGWAGAPLQFEGATGMENQIRARRPLEYYAFRWGLLTPIQKAEVMEQSFAAAKAAGLEHSVKELLKDVSPGTPEYRRLCEYAFSLFQFDTGDAGTRAVNEAARIESFFIPNSRGKLCDVKARPVNPKNIPKDFDHVPKKLLEEALNFRVGLKIVDMLPGGYDYRAASWRNQEVINTLRDHIADVPGNPELNAQYAVLREVMALDEQRRALGADILGAKMFNHHKREHWAEHDAIPLLKKQAEMMPQRHIEDLIMHQDPHAWHWVEHDISAGDKQDFKAFSGKTLEAAQPEVIWKEVESVYVSVDTRVARSFINPAVDSHIMPINHFTHGTFDSLAPQQQDGLQNVFLQKFYKGDASNPANVAGATEKARAYMRFMNKLSNFSHDEEVLHKLTNAMYFDTYRFMKGQTAFRYFEDRPWDIKSTNSKVRGSHMRFNEVQKFDRKDWRICSTWVGKLGKGSGAARNAGDNHNIATFAVQHQMALGTADPRALQLIQAKMVEMITGASGTDAATMTVGLQDGAHNLVRKTYTAQDLFLMNSQPYSSPAKNFVGDEEKSYGVNEIHHNIEKTRLITKQSLGQVAPELEFELEKEAGITTKIGGVEMKAPLWIYRFYLFAVLGAIVLAVKGKEESGEGWSAGFGSSGGGGGGGGGHPEHH